MANQRSPGQKLLTFTLDKSLASEMDKASLERGLNRSEFIRRALVDYLKTIGGEVDDALKFAPDRRRFLDSVSGLAVQRVADAADTVNEITTTRREVDYRKELAKEKASAKPAAKRAAKVPD